MSAPRGAPRIRPTGVTAAVALAATALLGAGILTLLSIAPAPSPPLSRAAAGPPGERTLYIASADGTSLAATFRAPIHATARRVPAVLVVPELMYADRNGAQPRLGAANLPYRLLADRLASEGIASLRYDQRGVGDTRLHEGVGLGGLSAQEEDVAALLNALAAQPEVDQERIALVGHGTGGLVAMAAAVAVPRLRAVVAVETPGRDPGTVLTRHVEDHILPAYGERGPALRAQLELAMTELRSHGTVPADLDQALATYVPVDRSELLRDLVSVDPTAAARQLRARVLIFSGRLDSVVIASDSSLLAGAVPGAQSVVGGSTGHFLELLPDLAADPGHATQMARSNAADTDPAAIDAVTGWLRTALH